MIKKKTKLALKIDEIVSMHRMPKEAAVPLLSSTVLFLTNQCNPDTYISTIAHTRLTLDGEYQDASAALADWLDSANEIFP